MGRQQPTSTNSTSTGCNGCACMEFNKTAKVKRTIDEARETRSTELDLVDKGITSIDEIPGLMSMEYITRLTLSHNKIRSVPSSIANLYNLEILNLFNNNIDELPTSISSMPKLKILNLGMNRLSVLPRGFGAFPALEVLDLTYNNLNEKSLSKNFFIMNTLRALYLGDNDFEKIPPEIGNLKDLEILSLRDNDLIAVPKEIGELTRLRELHIQGNRLTLLPPELGYLIGLRFVLRMENNPWVTSIADQLALGASHVAEYLKTDAYKYLYGRSQANAPPPKTNDKSKKISRRKD